MLKNILIGAICLLLATTIANCKKPCGNCPGICSGNTCICPDPYSGTNCDTLCPLGEEGYMCQTLSRDRFLGTWSCTSADQSTNSQTYLITFTANSYPLFMNMNNFNNTGRTLVCTMTGKYKYEMYDYLQDTTGPFVKATGTCKLDNGKITMYIYTATNFYFATAVQQ